MSIRRVVAVHGAPRSGTTWLGELFNSSPVVAYRYQPLFSHAFRGRVDSNSDAESLASFFADLAATDDDFVLQAGTARLAATAAPVFRKASPTHLVYKEVRFHDLLPHFLATAPDLVGVGIVRDPRAVLASWKNAPREYDARWSFSREWRHAPAKNAGLPDNWYGFERWRELATLFLELAARYPARFRLVRYEDLVADPVRQVEDLLQFCGLEMQAQTLRFIEDSTSRDDHDPYGVFKLRTPGQQAFARLDERISAEIARALAGTALARFLSE